LQIHQHLQFLLDLANLHQTYSHLYLKNHKYLPVHRDLLQEIRILLLVPLKLVFLQFQGLTDH
jgi:hypothetical protein